MLDRKRKLNILFVDDERQILVPLKALFKRDYVVFTAVTGQAALEIVKKHSIQVVISDQRMPEMRGIDLLREVKKISPHTVRILLTGYADLGAVMDAVNSGEVFRFIEKPWSNTRLKTTVESAADISLAKTNAGQESKKTVSEIESERTGILVIDEDRDLWEKVHHLFGHKHNIYCTDSISQAMLLLEQKDVAVLLTETVVRGEEVSHLIHVLKQAYPLIVAIVATTQADASLIVRLINQGQIFRYLTKPIENHLLEFSIRAALKQYAEFKHEPILVISQPVESPSEEDVVSHTKISSLRERLKSLRQKMASLLGF